MTKRPSPTPSLPKSMPKKSIFFWTFEKKWQLEHVVVMAAGYDIAYIKMMGRWSSSCFERYLRLDISTVHDMARAMQTGHRARAPFFFDSLVTDGAEELLRLD